jgi:UDP-glucose 4-epimerase
LKKFLKRLFLLQCLTQDYITVKEIADIAVEVLKLNNVEYVFSGGDRGWKGDVPIVRLNSDKIRSKGWKNKYSSHEAIKTSIESIYEDALKNKFEWKGVVA